MRLNLQENIKQSGFGQKNHPGMDIIIVTTNRQEQVTYWEKAFNEKKKKLLKEGALFLCLYEEWPGGAGNGLGTLYAWQEAKNRIKKSTGQDIEELLQKGASIALYHTAGFGKRLYPLIACEKSNKGALKLPAYFPGTKLPIRLLEAVVRQTELFAPYRKGRLSVFWGDQLFIPSKSLLKEPSSFVDILGKHLAYDVNSWESQNLESYGILTRTSNKKVHLLDKVTKKGFEEWIAKEKISKEEDIALSLGCFSISYPFLKALLEEFSPELTLKQGKLDSDPHFWMAMSLDKETYASLMKTRDLDPHWERMNAFKNRFFKKFPSSHFLEISDIGNDSLWWDWGNISAWKSSALKFIKNDEEGKAIRAFFATPESETTSHVEQENSLLIDCKIKRGFIKNSLLIGVEADFIDVEDSVILGSKLKELTAKEAILYEVEEENELKLAPKSIRADALLPSGEKIKLRTDLTRSGKEDWNLRVGDNPYSYAEIADLWK